MKNLFKIFALLFAMGLFFVACDEVNLDEPELDDQITEDNAFAYKTLGDVFASVNDGTAASGKSVADCGISEYVDNQDGTYSMTITYPETGCFENGVTKTGVISVAFTSAWGVGSVATITFDDYAVNGRTLTGTVTATFTEVEPYPVFTIVGSNMLLTYEGGKSISWNTNRTLTMLTGFDTRRNKSDDEWKINGETNGTARSGKSFTNTETDLVTSIDCDWFVGGTIEMTINESDVYKMTFEATCGTVTIEYRGINFTRTLN